MTSAILLVLSAWAVLIDYGWQPAGGGGHEYIIQVQPHLIDTFQAQGFSSEIPAELKDIRRIRIVVGDETLPRETDSSEIAPKGGEQRTARYLADTSSGDTDSSASQSGMLGLTPLELMQIGLALAIAALLFLLWVHMGTRARYRELLRKSQN